MPVPEVEKEPGAESRDRPSSSSLVALEPRIRRFVRDLVRGSAVARGAVDDIVQEAMARAWRSRETFDARRGTLTSWLLRIAFRSYLDLRPRDGSPSPLVQAPVDGRPGPLDHMAARERAEGLLATLTGREREVLLRFYRDGQSVRAIAAALSAAEGTVKSLLHRGRQRLLDADRIREEDR